MKIFNKILVALCVLAVLSAAVCVFALAATVYTVDDGMELIDAYDAAAADKKQDALLAARNYFAKVNTEADGYAEYLAAYNAMEKSHIDNVLIPIANAYETAAATAETADEQYAAKDAAFKAAFAAKEIADPNSESYDGLAEIVMNDLTDFLVTWLYPKTQETHEGEDYQHVLQNVADKTFLSYVTLYAFDKTNAAYVEAEIDAKAEAVQAALNARIESDKNALYSKATLTDYTVYPHAQFMADFENERVGSKAPGSLTSHSINNALPNDVSNNANLCETAQSEDGNVYYHIRSNYLHYYNEAGEDKAITGQHNYWDLKWASEDNAVVEIDFSTEDVFPASFAVQSAMNHGGGRVFPTWFSLNNGNFNTISGSSLNGTAIQQVSLPGVIVAKQWTHFTMTISTTGVLTVYIDYVPIGSWDSDGSTPYVGSDYVLNILRLGQKNTGVVSFCVDNFTVYYGTSPRDVSYLSKISDDKEALLLFYGNVISNPDSSINDMSLAYEKASPIIPDYYNEGSGFVAGTSQEIQDAITAILGVDVEELTENLRQENLKSLTAKVADVEGMTRSLSNITARQYTVDTIQTFVEKNIFPVGDAAFTTATTKIAKFVKEIEEDTAANLFIKEMNFFNQHFTFSSMTKHYKTGKEAYELIDSTFVYSVAADNTSFQNALAIFAGADEIMAIEQAKNNSKKIIACIDKVKNYEADVWEEKYDEINPYIVTVREIVKENSYDPDTEDLDAALLKYEEMNVFFYGLLQQRHVEELQGRVDTFRTTASYIERIGAVSYVEQYIANNDIDLTNPSIASIVNAVDVMKSEVEKQKSEYDELLNQNTERFASAVSIMKAFGDYATLKNYYDKATEYFYSMNIVIYGEGGEVELDVSDAILTYHAIGDKLAETEKASAELIKVSSEYKAAAVTKNLTYQYLVACYRVIDKTDVSIEGVSAAKAAYEAALAAYNAEILPLNNEISVAGDAMCAVRSICNLKGIMSMIRSILY